jgi:hypothetical protein
MKQHKEQMHRSICRKAFAAALKTSVGVEDRASIRQEEFAHGI